MIKRAYGAADFIGDAAATLGGAYSGYHHGVHANIRAQQKAIADEQARLGVDALRTEAQRAALFKKFVDEGEGRAPQRPEVHRIQSAYAADGEPVPNYVDAARHLDVYRDAVRAGDAITNAQVSAGQRHNRALVQELRARDDLTKANIIGYGSGVTPVGYHLVAAPLFGGLGQFGAQALMGRFAPTAGPGWHAAASGAGALAGRLALRGVDHMAGRTGGIFDEAAADEHLSDTALDAKYGPGMSQVRRDVEKRSSFMGAAYLSGRRAALIKLSGAPESLNPLGWNEHGAVEPEKTPAQELMATGAGILAHMAGDPQELNKAVPPPANRIPEGAVDL